jgi:hypothetical protein
MSILSYTIIINVNLTVSQSKSIDIIWILRSLDKHPGKLVLENHISSLFSSIFLHICC